MTNNPSDFLRNDDSHGSKLVLLPKKSIIFVWDDLCLRFRNYYRRFHLDINIPRSILFFLLVGSLYMILTDTNCTDNKNCRDNYEKAKDTGTILGAGIGILFAMTTLHNQYHYNKLSRSSKYVEKWYGEEFSKVLEKIRPLVTEEFYSQSPQTFNSKLFNTCYSSILELKKSTDGRQTLQVFQTNILKRLLNNHDEIKIAHQLFDFFEHMGQDVKLHVADSEYLKDFFYEIVITYYELFRKYIEYCQVRDCNRSIHCNFAYIAQTWEKEGHPPELPSICKRPLIITYNDLKLSSTHNYFLKILHLKK